MLNPWSFNNDFNMLYIDQPVTAGFSYNSLVDGTVDLLQNSLFTEVQHISQIYRD
jgi:carboxypeptidase C (cathepsin A)